MSNILANNINPRSGNKITIGDVNTTVAIAGTATYEDVTSIDSVGIITARGGLNVGPLTGIAATISATGRIFTNATDFPYRAQGALVSGARAFYVNNTNNSSGANYHFYGNNADGASFTVTTAGKGYFKGDVGIGTDNPNYPLQIHTAATELNYLQFTNDDTGVTTSDGFTVGINNSDEAIIYQRSATLPIRVLTNGAERLRIDSSGRVLLGATSTNYSNIKLLVAGTAGTNYISMLNTTASDANEARFSYLHFRGTQSGGEVSSLASIGAQHDGSSDDQNGELTFRTNDGSDGNSPTERMRIDSSGRVLIGTTTEGAANEADNLTIADTDDVGITLRSTNSGFNRLYFSDATSGTAEYAGYLLYKHADNAMIFGTNSTERMRIDSNGNLGLGIASPSLTTGNGIHVLAVNAGQKIQTSDSGGWAYNAWADHTGSTKYIAGYRGSTGQFQIRPGATLVSDSGLTLDSSGNLYLNKTANNRTDNGLLVVAGGSDDCTLIVANERTNGGSPIELNRQSSDGTLISFYQAGSAEGTITVSGSSVSYNGGHLSRWTQLPGNAERTEILRGTVLTNLDEMCEWAYDAKDAVLYTEEDDLPEGVSVGDVKTPAVAAGTEDNEQLNRMKVSDVEGDPNVAGVFMCWDDDDTYPNDFYCSMTGDFVIRIAQGTTVARGDLLMSAGDGTAKPQDDDIVRSKTIAKVISTTVSETYSDGSYCVPCVLMAC